MQENGEFADNSRDVKTPETKVVGAQLSQSMSSEDCKRSLKLVGYVYEEIPTKVAAPIPDRLISCEKSTSPIRTSADDMPVEITQPSLIASSGNIQSMRPVVASERATVNDQRPGSSQTNAIHNTSSRDHEVYGNRVQHQSAGMSSLFALSGLESLSKLENYFNRDSGLATRMATRIRHALEVGGIFKLRTNRTPIPIGIWNNVSGRFRCYLSAQIGRTLIPYASSISFQ